MPLCQKHQRLFGLDRSHVNCNGGTRPVFKKPPAPARSSVTTNTIKHISAPHLTCNVIKPANTLIGPCKRFNDTSFDLSHYDENGKRTGPTVSAVWNGAMQDWDLAVSLETNERGQPSMCFINYFKGGYLVRQSCVDEQGDLCGPERWYGHLDGKGDGTRWFWRGSKCAPDSPKGKRAVKWFQQHQWRLDKSLVDDLGMVPRNLGDLARYDLTWWWPNTPTRQLTDTYLASMPIKVQSLMVSSPVSTPTTPEVREQLATSLTLFSNIGKAHASWCDDSDGDDDSSSDEGFYLLPSLVRQEDL